MSDEVNRRALLRGIGAAGVGGAMARMGVPVPPIPLVPGARPARMPARRSGPGVWGDQGDGTFRNPVLNMDFSDPDVIRVGADFYLVSSEFHLMGMTVLHSRDLVNWSYLGRVYDRLDISPYYDTPRPSTDPNTRYSKGSWAPALRHHDGRFWIYFCTPTEGCFMTTAVNPAGPWEPLTAVKLYAPGEHPWEDPCPLWDTDGQAYLGHSLKGAGPIIIHRLSPDGRTLLDDGQLVYSGPNAEGTKLYKRAGHYYLVIPQNGFTVGDQWVLRSDSIYGPYVSEAGKPVLKIGNGVLGPHQGGLVDTPTGEWWFMHFEENGAIGRVVWLEPAWWTEDGWLRMGVDADGDGVGEPVINYPKPDVGHRGQQPITAPASSDDFSGPLLGLQWEWNHNPVAADWSLTERPGYLRLRAVGTVGDAFLANNTATQKVLGRIGVATTELDVTGMVDGQNAGLLHISASAQWIAVHQTGGVRRFRTVISGTATDGPVVGTDTVWLRSTIDLDGDTLFHYSEDGLRFSQLGGPVPLSFANWKGDKLGLFNFNSAGTGGIADFAWFDYAHDGPNGGAPRHDIAPAYTFAGPVTAPVNAGPNPYNQASELSVLFRMTPAALGEMTPIDKLPATADGRAGGWSVQLHADGSLDWIIGGAAGGTVVHVADAYTAGVSTSVACTLAVGPDGPPVGAVYLDGTRRAALRPVPNTVLNTTTAMRLGMSFAGTLTDVRIWTRALREPEIRSVLTDRTAPSLHAHDVHVRPDGRADLGFAEVSDANPVILSTNAPPPLYHYPPGNTTITWTATDAAGNTATTTTLVRRLP